MRQTIKYLLISFFFLFIWNAGYGQQDTIIRLYHRILNKPIFYVIDGLKISSEKYREIKLDAYCVRSLTVDKKKDEVRIKSKLLIIFNDFSLDKENIKLLSRVNEDDIIFLRYIRRECATNKYGKKGKYGVLIINTR